MSRNAISVLIVDDSAFMRKALRRMLSSDTAIRVIGEACDGEEAIDAVRKLKPDVMTLDIRMPGMNGLRALEIIMRDTPVPVIIVSSLTSEGGEITLQALSLGAVDFIDKSACHTMMDIIDIADMLIQKVKVLSRVTISRTTPVEHEQGPPPEAMSVLNTPISTTLEAFIAIGASTGGPMALERVLTMLPADLPATVLVVQHMPVGFTLSFAERLDRLCKLPVKEAQEDDPVLPGHILIAPAGYHLRIRGDGRHFYTILDKKPHDTLYCPSVDYLMESIAENWRGPSMGILMSGMGNDGIAGIAALKNNRARIVVQNEETCVVFGMPKAAINTGLVDAVLHLDLIADEIVGWIAQLGVKNTSGPLKPTSPRKGYNVKKGEKR